VQKERNGEKGCTKSQEKRYSIEGEKIEGREKLISMQAVFPSCEGESR
jgi:hypothetical protein